MQYIRALHRVSTSQHAGAIACWEPLARTYCEAEPSTPTAAKRSVRSRVFKLSKKLLELESMGRGQRVKKSYWPEGRFWHIVDVHTGPTRPYTPKKSEKDHKSDEATDSGQVDDEKAEESIALKSVYGVKFVDNAPHTGRVVRIHSANERAWLLVDK